MAGYSALPALGIQSFSPLQSAEQVQDYQLRAAQLPGQIQESQDEASVRHTQFQNGSLANAAAQVQALDPDQRSAAWDQKMSDLAEKGVPQARQYIGRYSDDRASSVQSIFSGQAGQNAAAAAKQGAQANPQMMQQLMQQPPEQRQKMVDGLNQAITAFGRVNNSDDLQSEINMLQQAGVIGKDLKQIPGLDLSRTDQLGYSQNYNAIYKFLQNQMPYRDALVQAQTAENYGVKPQAQHDYVVAGGNVFDKASGTWAPGAPVKDSYEYLPPDKTGAGPGVFDKSSGKASALTGPDNSASLAPKLIQSESGGNPNAQNPQPGQTSGGIGGMTDGTYVAAARAAIPALKNASDADILQIKKSGQLNGLNTDLVTVQNRQDAQTLKTNGLPVTSASVAMAYKLGADGATKVLQAAQTNPNTPLGMILPKKVMDVNPQLKNQTVGTYSAQMVKQFGDDQFGAQQNPFGKGPVDQELDNPDPAAKEILGQTGLNYPAFMMLTGSGSQLARDKVSRTNAVNLANQFAKQRGVDVSTFKSQYKAANDTLEQNIERKNNSAIMEDELLGTIQNLKPAANDATISNVNAANAAAVWAGKQTNGPVSAEYSFYLGQLREELGGYFAALSGRSQKNISDADYKHSESIIKDGLNSRGAQGLEDAIVNSTQKMQPVMERSIDRARQSVWNLFGVGQNYKPQYPNSAGQGADAVRGGGSPNLPGMSGGGAAPTRKTIGNNSYEKRNGQWFQVQ